MRRVNMVLSALLISSMIGGPALAAATTPQQQKEQQKQQTQQQRRQQTAAQRQGSTKDEKGAGFAIHPTQRKSNSSNWLSGGHAQQGWSF
jgi:Ni/Co efflux regulator RcnB